MKYLRNNAEKIAATFLRWAAGVTANKLLCLPLRGEAAVTATFLREMEAAVTETFLCDGMKSKLELFIKHRSDIRVDLVGTTFCLPVLSVSQELIIASHNRDYSPLRGEPTRLPPIVGEVARLVRDGEVVQNIGNLINICVKLAFGLVGC